MATQLTEATILPSAIMRRLTRATSQLTNISEPAFRSDQRWKGVARARFAIMLVARENGKRPSTIGQFFGRDHSSIIHGVKRARQLEQEDSKFADLVHQLRIEAVR